MASVPRRILLPIQGFEKMPLVSLIPDVEQMVWIAEQNCNQEELVIIDEVETEIILDSSNENRALISTIKLGISTESTTWFCEDCICMHEEEEQ
ncbi:unnamed protein product [Rotaria socialis]|uniref:Uncharacterized protein n=1 Tax=Rotaria socialis TaxID=392032 RepID=A0A818E3U6_9BILA|nr:unnamed protein product [Rotaria socialis]CAF4261224.1 unnamed protein product [Rotaria socialis]